MGFKIEITQQGINKNGREYITITVPLATDPKKPNVNGLKYDLDSHGAAVLNFMHGDIQPVLTMECQELSTRTPEIIDPSKIIGKIDNIHFGDQLYMTVDVDPTMTQLVKDIINNEPYFPYYAGARMIGTIKPGTTEFYIEKIICYDLIVVSNREGEWKQ
jgi:hypothetical protein